MTTPATPARPHGFPWRIGAWILGAAVLAAPLVAMRLTDEVDWTASDFVFAGALIFGALGIYEAAVRLSRNLAYRAGAALAALTAVLLIWANLAVGIIGDENNALNLIFWGVLAVLVFGAVAVRFRARAMARVLAAVAAAQGVCALVALTDGVHVMVLTAGFAGLWLVADDARPAPPAS
ncbi:MAG: hypothetical protein V7678_07315 [Brevundimonas sp.]